MNAPLRLGFARGVAPTKWANRWKAIFPETPLVLVPLTPAGRLPAGEDPVDVLLERVAPGGEAESSSGEDRTRHGVRLYVESLALVLPVEHELAEATVIEPDDLTLVHLLDHPDHAAEWPEPQPWADPSWAPKNVRAALELVGTGLGGILLPLPFARHLVNKRAHVIVPLSPIFELPGTEIWASWDRSRDDATVQQFVGVLRGRTGRSSRGEDPGADDAAQADDAAASASAASAGPGRSGGPERKPAAKKPTAKQAGGQAGAKAPKRALPKNSRGAQLAAAAEKRERAKRAKAAEKQKQAKRRKR
ncbi:LysR substrate-binding domain-containing protein [Leucobacter iarius]|uniref:LysR substrate-binding domain-containing protein n=1 Tax=Leucobacter iarius TaxID=333963 RepID=A0ABN2LBA3_9MICO